MQKEKSDAEFIAEFKHGREEAFEALVSRYAQKVYSMASRLTRNQEDAEEVLQDVFVTVFRKVHDFEGKSSFSSWLYRVTVNAALMKLRKRGQDQSVALEDVLPQMENALALRCGEETHADEAAFRKELLMVLDAAIRKLPDEYRPVFVLRDIDGLTSREVSEMLEVSIPAVKSRLHRSRFMLRKKLAEFYDEYRRGVRSDEKSVGNM